MSLLNFIEIISQFLIFISIVCWLQFITNKDLQQFDIKKDINTSNVDFFYLFEKAAQDMIFYRRLQALTIFFLILQTIKYFYFSKKMAKLLDVFHSAKIDVLFFMGIFAIILIAFSIMAFFIFGVSISGFNTFDKSLLSCCILLIGEVNLNELIQADSILGPLFYFSFMVKKIFCNELNYYFY